ncbi:MAG: pentapeptide repeat-containing protein [Streptosporangiaceae bacterium]
MSGWPAGREVLASAARPRRGRLPRLPAKFTAAALPGNDLGDSVICELLAYADLDLSGREAAGAEIEACTFANVNLSQGRLRRGLIRDVRLERCDLANLRALDSSLTRVELLASRMTGLSLLDDDLRDVRFDGCRVDLASFRMSKFADVLFSGCRMGQADFTEADLRGARFENCDLTGAQFSGARMTGTRFARCDLTEITGVTSMRGAVITSADAVTLAYILAGALGITIEDE